MQPLRFERRLAQKEGKVWVSEGWSLKWSARVC